MPENQFQSWKTRAIASITNKKAAIFMVVAVAIVAVALGYVMNLRPEAARFTTFYVLGLEGKPTDYPTELLVGEEAEVVLTVANHEYRTTSYEIVIEIDGIKNARIGPITIDHGEEWQQKVSFTPREMGEEVPVEFLLYRQGHEDSYKSLRLWVDIVG